MAFLQRRVVLSRGPLLSRPQGVPFIPEAGREGNLFCGATLERQPSHPAWLGVEWNAEGELTDHLEKPVVREGMEGSRAHVAVVPFERVAAEHAGSAHRLHGSRHHLQGTARREVLG